MSSSPKGTAIPTWRNASPSPPTPLSSAPAPFQNSSPGPPSCNSSSRESSTSIRTSTSTSTSQFRPLSANPLPFAISSLTLPVTKKPPAIFSSQTHSISFPSISTSRTTCQSASFPPSSFPLIPITPQPSPATSSSASPASPSRNTSPNMSTRLWT